MMLRIYLLRHGQTECSQNGFYCGGECDKPLNPTGLAAAAAIARALGGQAWTGLWSSPQRRATQTIAPLSKKTGLGVQTDERLREMAYGDWNGKSPSELQQSTPELYRDWLTNPKDVSPPGGETAAAVAARAKSFIDSFTDAEHKGTILVASHKTTLRLMIATLLGVEINDYRRRLAQPLGGLSLLTFHESGARLDLLGDLCHLPPELRHVAGS